MHSIGPKPLFCGERKLRHLTLGNTAASSSRRVVEDEHHGKPVCEVDVLAFPSSPCLHRSALQTLATIRLLDILHP